MLIPFRELFEKYKIDSKGILHVGANKGQEAPEYKLVGLDKMVFVEALPDIYKELVEFTSPYGAICIEACVSDKDGEEVEFNIASNEGQSSSLLNFKHHAHRHPTVKFVGKLKLTTTRLDTLLDKLSTNWDILDGLTFLAMDLQGAELLALKGMGDLLHQFDYAYLEVNKDELYENNALVGEIDAYLAKFGFVGKEEKWTGNGWGDKFYLKERSIS